MPNFAYFCFLPGSDNRQLLQLMCKKNFPKETLSLRKSLRKKWGKKKKKRNIVLAKPDENLIPETGLALVERSPWSNPCSGQDPLAQVAQGCGHVSAEYLQEHRVNGPSEL